MPIINRVMVGESLVGHGNEVAHIDLLLGPRGSAAEEAFCNALTNNKDGFTTLLAVIAPNLPCRPSTVMYNKVTIRDARQAVQMFGPAQYAVAKAVQDSVSEGVIPASEADDIVICVGVFIHWEAMDDAKIQEFNYQATKEAIARAAKGRPTVEEATAARSSAHHPFSAARPLPASAPTSTAAAAPAPVSRQETETRPNVGTEPPRAQPQPTEHRSPEPTMTRADPVEDRGTGKALLWLVILALAAVVAVYFQELWLPILRETLGLPTTPPT